MIMAQDYRIMTSGTGFVGMNEIRIGMPIPPFMSRVVQMKIHPRVAHEVLTTGRFYNSKEALANGLVDKVCDRKDLIDEAIKMGQALKPIFNKTLIASIRKTVHSDFLEVCDKGYSSPDVEQYWKGHLGIAPKL